MCTVWGKKYFHKNNTRTEWRPREYKANISASKTKNKKPVVCDCVWRPETGLTLPFGLYHCPLYLLRQDLSLELPDAVSLWSACVTDSLSLTPQHHNSRWPSMLFQHAGDPNSLSSSLREKWFLLWWWLCCCFALWNKALQDNLWSKPSESFHPHMKSLFLLENSEIDFKNRKLKLKMKKFSIW